MMTAEMISKRAMSFNGKEARRGHLCVRRSMSLIIEHKIPIQPSKSKQKQLTAATTPGRYLPEMIKLCKKALLVRGILIKIVCSNRSV